MKVVCRNDSWQWNTKMIPLDIDKEYEVDSEFTVNVGKSIVPMYMIDWKPFRADRFDVLDE